MKTLLSILITILLCGRASALTPGTDSRVELQALLDATPAGGVLVLPNGDYPVSRAGTAYYSLHVPAGVTVRGSGSTTISQLPGTAPSVRILQLDGDGAVVERLSLDGNYEGQTVDEHRAGAFITADDVTLRNVTVLDFSGDGVYIQTGADRALLDGVVATHNQRNGITIAGGTGTTVRGGVYADNAAQQVDSEPGFPWATDDVTIADAVIDCGASTQYALTVSGSGPTARSTGWRVTGNTITGGVNVVWSDDVLIASNTITLPYAKAVRVYRNSNRVTVARNTITQTDSRLAYPSAVFAVGTGTGEEPSDVLVADNTLSCASASALCVRAEGIDGINVVGNTVVGPGYASVYVRATNPAVSVQFVSVVSNTLTGASRGVVTAGNVVSGVPSTIDRLFIAGNTIDTPTVGVIIDPAVLRFVAALNTYSAGVTSGRLGEL